MSTFKRFSPLFLILAVLGDFSFPYFLEAQLPRFNHFSNIISNLGEVSSPVSTQFLHYSIVTGCLFIFGSLGIPAYFKNEPAFVRNGLAVSISLYGFGDCIISGLIQINKNQQTFLNPAYFFHASFTGLAMFGLLFVSIICTLTAYSHAKNWLFVFYGFCLVGTLISLFLFIAYYFPFIGSHLAQTRGLWQELALFFLYLPILGIAVKELAVCNTYSYKL